MAQLNILDDVHGFPKLQHLLKMQPTKKSLPPPKALMPSESSSNDANNAPVGIRKRSPTRERPKTAGASRPTKSSTRSAIEKVKCLRGDTTESDGGDGYPTNSNHDQTVRAPSTI